MVRVFGILRRVPEFGTVPTALLGCVLVVLWLTSPASAQVWGRGRVPQEGACFYEDANFQGDYFCVRAGGEYDEMPGGMNDRISSIQIFGNAEVLVHKDSRFKGKSKRFDRSIRNLKNEGWNDRVSSLRVTGSYAGGDRPFGGGGGGYYNNPDRIVRRAYEDILHREPDAAGLRLYRSRMIDDGWTEQQVREALRNSPEYRELTTMTYPKAQQIVRQAYLNVLGREPDPSGSRGYVERVMNDRWTQQDVERELRKSPEYRQRR